MLNKCCFIGTLGRDPEIRSTQSGSEIANLSIAVSEKWKDKQTGEQKEKTEWIRVAAFSPGLVNIIKTYLGKGSKVYIEGKMQTRKWTDQNGTEKYSTEIVLQGFDSKLIMLSPKKEGAPQKQEPAAPPVDNGAMLDDEIPFTWLLACASSASMLSMKLLDNIPTVLYG